MSAAQDEVDALFANQVEKFDRHPEDVAQSPSDRSEQSSDVENSPQFENGESLTRRSRPRRLATGTSPRAGHSTPTPDPKASLPTRGPSNELGSFPFVKTPAPTPATVSPPRSLSPRPRSKLPTSVARERQSEESRPEDDDGFMRSWRQHRINELQDPRVRRTSPSQRTYGSLEAVDAVGYLDAIEKVSADTVVVVCIYDDRVRRACFVTSELRSLAPSRRRRQHVDDRGTHSQASVASSKIV
jgi:hypothetical protein